MDWYNWIWKVV